MNKMMKAFIKIIFLSIVWLVAITTTAQAQDDGVDNQNISRQLYRQLLLTEGQVNDDAILQSQRHKKGKNACKARKSNIRHIVCFDPVLHQLDQDLMLYITRLYSQNKLKFYNDFIEKAETKCGKLRNFNQDIHSFLNMSACLYDEFAKTNMQYAQQLGFQKVVQRPAMPASDLHPYCLALLMGAVFDADATMLADKIDISICRSGSAHIPTEEIATENSVIYSVDLDISGQKNVKSFNMRPLGTYNDDEKFYIIWIKNGDGQEISSHLLSLKKTDNAFIYKVNRKNYFGDRCNRGLSFAELRGNKLRIYENITSSNFLAPHDNRDFKNLYALVDEDGNRQATYTEGYAAIEPYIDLENYASPPCFGKIVSEFDLSTNSLEDLGIFITNFRTVQYLGRLQQCFNNVLQTELGEETPIAVQFKQLSALGDIFRKNCMQ
jgi:hypothetical protein